MALDTRDRRASAIACGLAFLVVLPTPDGLALDQGDRQQTAFCYRGIAAGAAVIVRPVSIRVRGGGSVSVPVRGGGAGSLRVRGGAGDVG